MKNFTVKENGREMNVFIPDTGDPSYNEELALSSEEKTRADLKALPPKEQPNVTKKEVAEFLKEQKAFRERGSKKYF